MARVESVYTCPNCRINLFVSICEKYVLLFSTDSQTDSDAPETKSNEVLEFLQRVANTGRSFQHALADIVATIHIEIDVGNRYAKCTDDLAVRQTDR